jgi:transmembrane sensor
MENEFSKLVSKVLAGEASDDEKKLLQQTLLESSEHSLIYNQLKEYWDAEVRLARKRDKDAFEENLLARLDFEPEVQVSKHRNLYFRIASAAAILFFVMTCTMTYLYIVQPNQIYTYSAQSSPIEYMLNDGTKVTLNKNSSLTLNSNFGNKQRDVILTGEGYFKVAKDKTRPFTVEALGTKTEVLGTSFNVKINYATSEISTTLVEGSVHFKAENCDVMLKPNEKVVFNNASKQYSSEMTDTQYSTAWITGRFNYTNIRFVDLANKLGKIYNIKIDISDKKIANRIISANFLSNESIEELLNAFETQLEFKYNRVDSTQIKIISLTLKK